MVSRVQQNFASATTGFNEAITYFARASPRLYFLINNDPATSYFIKSITGQGTAGFLNKLVKIRERNRKSFPTINRHLEFLPGAVLSSARA